MLEKPYFSIYNGTDTYERIKKEKNHEKIPSFSIDHNKLQPGVYVSRKDHIGDETITTFDLRMTSPMRNR